MPENWTQDYFDWMHNIQDWCISRQLWWGHRIPAWYDDAGNVYVARDEAEVRRKYGLGADIAAAPGRGRARHLVLVGALAVLDARLARAKRRSSRRSIPTSVLVTSCDIIFFWVARMIMMGLKFIGRRAVPRRLHPRPGPRHEGQKMSKTQGQHPRSARSHRRRRSRYACSRSAPTG